jgi:hypothetical protein
MLFRESTMGLSNYIGKYWAGAEAIYAIIIAMTFTSIFRTYIAIPEALYFNIIYSALFCCIAWGFTDGLFYLWERRHNLRIENDIIDLCSSDQKNDAIPLIEEQLDNTILSNINEENRMQLYHELVLHLAATGKKEIMSGRDAFNIILGTLLISTGAGSIVILPFFLTEDLNSALNASNWLGISLLFIIGYYRTHERELSGRLMSGFGTAVIGMIIASITVLLGG